MSGIVAIAASMLVVGGLAAAMALALAWTKPTGADLPAVTTSPAPSFAPIVLDPPSPAPADRPGTSDRGGGGGGGRGGNNGGGRDDKDNKDHKDDDDDDERGGRGRGDDD
jgi:hypothetical protein